MTKGKVYCNTCKFNASVDRLLVVECNSNCILKERPSYKKYMKDLEIKNAKINPVTGKENRECPVNQSYYSPYDPQKWIPDPTPPQYVLCAVRNKNFDCKHHEKTKIKFYSEDFFCPYCDTKLKVTDYSYKCWGYYGDTGNADYVMKCDKCGSRVYFNKDFDICDFWGEYNYDHDDYSSGKRYFEAIRKTKFVYKKLGITIPLSKKFNREDLKKICIDESGEETVIRKCGFLKRVLGKNDA